MRFQTFFDLLIYKTRGNLRAEISRLYLNYAWWALEPLFSMTVFYVVFGIFMNSPTPHFGLFLLIGTTQWQWFATTTVHASASILDGAWIMQQVSIHKVFFPLEVFLQDSFKHLFVLLLMAVFLLFYPVPIQISWLALPLVLVVQGLLVLSCSLLFAAIVPFFPDLKLILATVMNVLFFISGIFFDVDLFVLPEHRHWMYSNPMAGIIREYRNIIIQGQWPDWAYLGWVLLGTLAVLCLAAYIIARNNKMYPRLCQQ